MDFDEIAKQLKRSRKHELDRAVLRELGFSKEAADLLMGLGGQKIAGDFVIPDTKGIVAYNRQVPFLPNGWMCFASSGSGDLWVLKKAAPHHVAFVDHDKESAAKAEPLGITLRQWVELAWYMRQHDAAYDPDDESGNRTRSTQARRFLESLAKNLSKKYPYKL